MRAILVDDKQFSAVDYLMKPVDKDQPVIKRLDKKSKQKENAGEAETLLHNLIKAGSLSDIRLCLPNQKGFTIVKLNEIIYCEAQRSYTIFRFVNNKSIVISKPLFDYDQLLTDTIFFRAHKSFLINLMHIKEYVRGEGGSVIMSNGMEVEISRRRKEQFLLKVKEIFKY